ncbi:MAG: DUF5686 family protein [Alloprevotella sp.]
MKKILFLILLTFSLAAGAQTRLSGKVVDFRTGEVIPLANVVRLGEKKAVTTDLQGRFSMPWKAGKYRISMLGYQSVTLTVTPGTDSLFVKLKSTESDLGTAEVVGHKKKYSRKNNPAVEFMKKVIAAKGNNDLKRHDFYSIDKYTKMLFALNDVTEKVFEEGKFKRLPFLKDHVEVCNETGRLILPISVDETVSREIFRKTPKSQKSVILGTQNTGLNNFFSTGDILTDMIKDCFTDVDIYKNEVRLLQYPFMSPIGDNAIAFYRYFLVDTLMVGKDKCIQLDFTPNNPQDFGFSGSIFVVADSTYRVRRTDIGIPKKSDVNFVESMRIIQDFRQLPSGEQVLVKDDMLVQIKVASFLQKLMVRRTTDYSNFSFDPLPEKEFRFKGSVHTKPDAQMKDKLFWQTHRPDSLTKTESGLDAFMAKLQKVKGFKPILWVLKAFIENFVETSTDPKKPSKVDIGPVNTIISQNFVDGLRLRASAQTTANLHKQLFLKGYIAYGFKDKRPKGMGEVTWSFNKKDYLPREFPVNNLTFTFTNDVMSPSDKFLPTDKDNVFTSFKWTTVDHMMYFNTLRLTWDKEWENGLRYTMQVRTTKDTPTAALFYRPLTAGNVFGNPADNYHSLRTSDLKIGVTYQPGVTWINTKQRRLATNHDAPKLSLSHSVGLYDFGRATYTYNFTEAGIYKRFWLGSWGKIDCDLRGGVQWDKVPFPLLIMPAANLSYIMEDNTFCMIDNMEFLNDRYASLMLSWDMNGKILNRIPLIRRLKWREYIGCNVLWGTLSKKNNPYLARNANDPRMLFFPGHFYGPDSYEPISKIMDKKVPYVEVMAGIHNIFKIFHIEGVYRVNYHYPGTKKWGVRGMLRITF